MSSIAEDLIETFSKQTNPVTSNQLAEAQGFIVGSEDVLAMAEENLRQEEINDRLRV